jgi:hypothetical protein
MFRRFRQVLDSSTDARSRRRKFLQILLIALLLRRDSTSQGQTRRSRPAGGDRDDPRLEPSRRRLATDFDREETGSSAAVGCR